MQRRFRKHGVSRQVEILLATDVASTLLNCEGHRYVCQPIVAGVNDYRYQRLRQRLVDDAYLIVSRVDDYQSGGTLRTGRGEEGGSAEAYCIGFH